MKTCTSCKQEKPLSMYHKMGANKNGSVRYRGNCKDCKAEVDRNNYDHDRSLGIHRKLVERNKRIVLEYLSNHPCVDCGETDPIVLEFDHVRGEKIKNVSRMVARKVSVENLLAEINKCDVRCANCHRRVTAQRGNWMILSLAL